MLRVLLTAILLSAALAVDSGAQVWLTDTAGSAPTPQGPPPSLEPLGARACTPPSPARRWAPSSTIVESRATSVGVETWALIFDGRWASAEAAVFTSVLPDRPFKIAWRLTGSGPLRLAATSRSGVEYGPASGPTLHASNWDRPGDEWGSTFLLPEEGCWRIRASRDDGFGELWIVVRS